MMAGPAALAVQTGAALMPAVLWFDDDGWGVRIGEEIPQPAEGTRPQKVAAMTQEIAQLLRGAASGTHPHDWLMLQKVFVADLDPERQAAARAARRQRTGSLTSQEAP